MRIKRRHRQGKRRRGRLASPRFLHASAFSHLAEVEEQHGLALSPIKRRNTHTKKKTQTCNERGETPALRLLVSYTTASATASLFEMKSRAGTTARLRTIFARRTTHEKGGVLVTCFPSYLADGVRIRVACAEKNARLLLVTQGIAAAALLRSRSDDGVVVRLKRKANGREAEPRR